MMTLPSNVLERGLLSSLGQEREGEGQMEGIGKMDRDRECRCSVTIGIGLFLEFNESDDTAHM